jgi:hypothetical protein
MRRVMWGSAVVALLFGAVDAWVVLDDGKLSRSLGPLAESSIAVAPLAALLAFVLAILELARARRFEASVVLALLVALAGLAGFGVVMVMVIGAGELLHSF